MNPSLRAPRLLVFALGLLTLAACSKKDGPTDPSGGDDPIAQPDPPTTNTTSIGSTGGRVGLADGTAVVFPPGAVGTTTPVTVTKKEASGFLDGTSATTRLVVNVSAGGAQFQQDVQIRVPLPSTMTAADSLRVLAGLIDDSTGAITVVHPTIQIVDQKPFVVVTTRHFSDWFFEWLGDGKFPPASAGPLEVPYYNQGSSAYCWAATLQMVTRAVKQDDAYTIPQIVGRMGIDEGGITAISYRFSPTIAAIVSERTGVKPTRQAWDYVNANLMKEYIKREIGLNGRPVGLFATQWNHAVVVVGYEGDTFIIHDPQSTDEGSVGYERRPWSAIGGAMGLLDKYVTLVVPASLGSGTPPVRVNLLPYAVKVSKPSSGADDPAAVYTFRWDHTRATGLAFRHTTSDELIDVLPGNSRTISSDGEIQITNASRTSTAEASVWLDVTAVGAPAGTGHYSLKKTISVGPNAAVDFKPGVIPVDTFRYNKATPTDYLFSVAVLVGGTKVDGESFLFKIGPAVPEITSLDPASAMVGETVRIRGKDFGRSAVGNKVTLAGAELKVQDIKGWADDLVTIRVPSGAKSGEIKVVRGEVGSNAMPFTLKELVTSQSFDLTWGNEANAVLINATLNVEALSGGWKSVFQERSVFNPEEWVKLYFGTQAPPSGGTNGFLITITPGTATSKLTSAELKFVEARWIVRSQTPNGLPVTEVEGTTVTISEEFVAYSKQVDLWLRYRAISGSDTLDVERDGLYLSFSPGHVGMRVAEPAPGAAGRERDKDR